MSKAINVGFISTGAMAAVMADTVRQMPEINAYAVSSRTVEKAREFAAQYGFEKYYGSYEELVQDPNVDLVYIATPHSCHLQNMKLCAKYGKPILCEKAFTLNAEQAREAIPFAEDKKVALTEAIWPRYMPMAETLRSFVKSGKIGTIKAVTANLAYSVSNRDRVVNPSLGGGALLDMGVYPLTFFSILLGDEVVSVNGSAQLSSDGVDLQDIITLTYADGATATLYVSVLNSSDRLGCIYGTEGYALVGNINNYEYLEIYDLDHNLVERIDRPKQISGYEYQFISMLDAIKKGEMECAEMPHRESVKMMELMDRIRAVTGVRYPEEK